MKSHFLPNQTYANLMISWGNPYTSPPDGAPRHLWACSVPWPVPGMTNKELLDYGFSMAPEVPHDCGYAHCIGFETIKPRRRMSPEGKASIRRKRMEARIWKRDPLFAEQFIAEQLKRPYFDPEKIAQYDKARRKKIEEYRREIFESFVKDSIVGG